MYYRTRSVTAYTVIEHTTNGFNPMSVLYISINYFNIVWSQNAYFRDKLTK